MASQALIRQETFKTISAELQRKIPLMAQMWPAATRVDQANALRMAARVYRVAQSAISNSQKLQECSVPSLRSSIIRACQLGLELDPTLMHAALVPFKGQCQLIVGYRGYIQLATRSGLVSSISAEVVWDVDEFDFQLGSEPRLYHKPNIDIPPEKARAVYAVARLKDGDRPFRVLRMDYIQKIEQQAKRKGSVPWKENWEEMARKTAVRNLAKYLPQSADAQVEAVRDEARDAGVMPPEVGWEEAEAEVIEAEATVEREPGQEG